MDMVTDIHKDNSHKIAEIDDGNHINKAKDLPHLRVEHHQFQLLGIAVSM